MQYNQRGENRVMRYIGFDIGDGESAVAVFKQGSGIEPAICPVAGGQSILSAVGKVRGEIVIGEQAYTDGLAEGLSVRFKSRFTYDPTSYDTVVLFVRGVLESLRESGILQEGDAFVVGCPAGWNAACKARYHDLMVRAGVVNPQVVSESRAAFLYAKYAKTVALDIDVLRESALVIDIGSSTLDFAYIVDGRETGVGTFGELKLGGGLLDEELLRCAVEKSKNRKEIQSVFEESKSWYSYAEIEARKVKEQYFIQAEAQPGAAVKKTVRICYEGVQKLPLELNAAAAERLVTEPLPALNGRSFSGTLQSALDSAKQVTAGNPPRVVMLTGGASRMRFFQDQCRNTFASAIVVCCPEPEFSIAKGLAYAGWIDENMREFRKSIAEEITHEKVSAIAAEALPELMPGVIEAMVELVLEEVAIPAVRKWKSGETATLEEMNRQIQTRTEQVLHSQLAEEAITPVVEAWLKTLSGKLQALIDPICDRYQVPRREMNLSFSRMGEAEGLLLGAKELLGFSFIGTLISVLLSILGGALCGGGGIALIAAGPAGFFAGLAVGAIVAAAGWSTLSGLFMKANLPAPFRWINVEKQLRSDGAKKNLRDALRKELTGKDSVFSQGVVDSFADAFQGYLRQLAQAAEIPIQ